MSSRKSGLRCKGKIAYPQPLPKRRGVGAAQKVLSFRRGYREAYYEKDSINTICDAMHLRVWATGYGLPLPTLGRDSPLDPHRLRRDPHLLWLPHRHRLQIPL